MKCERGGYEGTFHLGLSAEGETLPRERADRAREQIKQTKKTEKSLATLHDDPSRDRVARNDDLMAGRLVSLLFFVLLVYLARLLQRNREALKASSSS